MDASRPRSRRRTTIYEHLKQTATDGGGRGGGGGGRPSGDVAAARASAAVTLSSQLPDSVHRARAARAARGRRRVDRRQGHRLDRHAAPVRRAHRSRDRRSRIAEDRVRVIVPDMGSGYGGKHTGEQAIEAARLARAAGKPVKLVYARDEEFIVGLLPARAASSTSRPAVDAAGRLTFWEFDNYNSGNAGLPTPYVVANQRVAFHASDSPLRQGSYRGLAATANHYAREMHMDALARAARRRRGRVPPDAPRRTRACAPCSTPPPSSVGWPTAVAASDKAARHRVRHREGQLRRDGRRGRRGRRPASPSPRVVVAFECGAIVNPDGLRNQVEGSIVQGLGGALFEAVEFAQRPARERDDGVSIACRASRTCRRSRSCCSIAAICRQPAPARRRSSASRRRSAAPCAAFGEVETALPVRLSSA